MNEKLTTKFTLSQTQKHCSLIREQLNQQTNVENLSILLKPVLHISPVSTPNQMERPSMESTRIAVMMMIWTPATTVESTTAIITTAVAMNADCMDILSCIVCVCKIMHICVHKTGSILSDTNLDDLPTLPTLLERTLQPILPHGV